MTLRKILAVALCILTVLSVMTAVAYASNQAQKAAVEQEGGVVGPSEEATTTTGTTTTKQNFSQWWENFYPQFNKFYQSAFAGITQVLLFGFNLLLKIVGLR